MEKFEQLSPLALAFMGDAIHTAFVREWVLNGNLNKMNNYHNLSKKFCNAKKQKETLEKIFDNLTDDEKDIVRKARNCHSKHSAKNFDEETYKKATAFESLLGFLHLSGKTERLMEILQKSVEE
ncbi:MAG: Mini-ribonuclease 3 [Clostridia bacterium]|nr:Mini-ribonuclease 3 [Clostridia bacterium]